MSRASQAALPLPFSAQPHLALVIQAGWASAQNQQVETIIPGATGERIGHAVSPAATPRPIHSSSVTVVRWICVYPALFQEGLKLAVSLLAFHPHGSVYEMATLINVPPCAPATYMASNFFCFEKMTY